MSILTIADINCEVDAEARVLDVRLAETLGYERPADIRPLIERHAAALERLGGIIRTVRKNGGRGRPAAEFWLSKRQALFICTKSETERATEATIEMVEVFDAYLGGRPVSPTMAGTPDLRPGFALMRVGGKLVTVDTRKFKVSETDRVVRLHRDGRIDVGTVRVDGMPNWYGARGAQEPWHKPDPNASVSTLRSSDTLQVFGLVVDEVKADRPKVPAVAGPKRRRPGAFEAGSDVLKDLVNAVRSASARMTKTGQSFEHALSEVLEDVDARRRNPGAAVRGATFDYDAERAAETMKARGLKPPPLDRTAEFTTTRH